MEKDDEKTPRRGHKLATVRSRQKWYTRKGKRCGRITSGQVSSSDT